MNAFKSVLDACCGSRMFWFDKSDPRTVFMDNRRENHEARDKTARLRWRTIVVNPDVLADFTSIPYPDSSFRVVVFDPPHLVKSGDSAWLTKKYGKLKGEWQEQLRRGFSECFRVLMPNGVLVFKWNERDIPVSQILALTPEKPLFGNRCGKQQMTHWIVFLKAL